MLPWNRAIITGDFDPITRQDLDAIAAASLVARQTIVALSSSDRGILSRGARQHIVCSAVEHDPRIKDAVEVRSSFSLAAGDVVVTTSWPAERHQRADVLVLPSEPSLAGVAHAALDDFLSERGNPLVALMQLQKLLPQASHAALLALVAAR